ncbi:MAG: ElyC/SanA/YdcF family protein [Rhodothermia bacterium]
MFLLKKLISPLLFPIPIILGLLLVGLIQMWRSRGSSRRQGFAWILSATVILVLLSFRPIPTALMSELESRYAPVVTPPDSSIQWVVVLGGGASDDPALGDPQRLSGSSVVRLVEGIRLSRHLPSSRLVVSGGAAFSSITEASLMRSLSLELGVADSLIVTEGRSMDTKDQAEAIAGIVGENRFFLVTSAKHMPRSMALFERQGLSPIAAPTDHLARQPTTIHPGGFFPSSLNIRTARLAWREYLGLLWAKLRGQA